MHTCMLQQNAANRAERQDVGTAALTSCSTLGGPKLRNTAAAIVLAVLRAAAAASGRRPLPMALRVLYAGTCGDQLLQLQRSELALPCCEALQ
jgi:hypothetical protein